FDGAPEPRDAPGALSPPILRARIARHSEVFEVLRPRKGLTAKIALSLLKKVVEVEQAHPDMASRIEGIEKEIVSSLQRLRAEIEKLSDQERKLMTVSVMNFIHDKADEMLVD
ncbi:MAG: hypothetical protein L0216_10435, partial [Planctomycetales bacterium]|nr:hypothetical protein [Planctomycetales bacterium]